MLARLIVWAIGAGLLLSTAALAAGTATTEPAKDPNKVQTASLSMAQRCSALEKQFDEAITTRGSMAKANSARMLRTQGGALCGQGHHEAGMDKIQQGLKEIGMKPSM